MRLDVFNHPGGNPALTPFDGGAAHRRPPAGRSSAGRTGTTSRTRRPWTQVSGIAVNGGDDLQWYVKALTCGWHLGPIADEDEHQREWATSEDGKTVVLTGGPQPKDHYYALQHNRTMAYSKDVVDGAPRNRCARTPPCGSGPTARRPTRAERPRWAPSLQGGCTPSSCPPGRAHSPGAGPCS